MTDFAREPRTSHNGQGSHNRKTPSTPKARRIQPSMFIEVTAIVGNFATTDKPATSDYFIDLAIYIIFKRSILLL